MKHAKRERRSDCPIGFTLDIVGDRWSLLILRDVLTLGKTRFRDFASEEGIASNVLSERLSRLEEAGVLERKADPADGRQIIYSPTPAGIALLPLVVEMAYWGATHDPQTGAPAQFIAAYQSDRNSLIAGMRAALAAI
ncbi:MAG: helix-turn-helix transcriptional regulator [Rhizobiaceae bacterium]|nr:helix-turn-helix transcriptional regulator [Rhizobiaceae bacterium]